MKYELLRNELNWIKPATFLDCYRCKSVWLFFSNVHERVKVNVPRHIESNHFICHGIQVTCFCIMENTGP